MMSATVKKADDLTSFLIPDYIKEGIAWLLMAAVAVALRIDLQSVDGWIPDTRYSPRKQRGGSSSNVPKTRDD